MKSFEYQVVPAPKKGEKAKGAKTAAEKFGVALTNLMNKMGSQGWEYIRSDTLPCDERVGLTGSKSVFQNMLVFRREMFVDAVEMVEREAEAPQKTEPPIKREPRLSPIPAELFDDPEPSEVVPMDEMPKFNKPAKEPSTP